MVQTPGHYATCRRTLNHVTARASREGLVFCEEPGTDQRYRHDGDVSNEWELVTLERLRRAASTRGDIELMRGHSPWYAEGDPARSAPPHQRPHFPGAGRTPVALELGRGAPVHPGRHLP